MIELLSCFAEWLTNSKYERADTPHGIAWKEKDGEVLCSTEDIANWFLADLPLIEEKQHEKALRMHESNIAGADKQQIKAWLLTKWVEQIPASH